MNQIFSPRRSNRENVQLALETESLEQLRKAQPREEIRFEQEGFCFSLKDGKRTTVSGIKATDNFPNRITWQNARFVDCNFNGSVMFFIDCEFVGGQVRAAQTEFERCNVVRTDITCVALKSDSCAFSNATIFHSGADVLRFSSNNTKFIGCEFRSGIIEAADDFASTQLFGCRFFTKEMQGYHFKNTTINSTTFTAQTQFIGCYWSNVTVDRVFIDSLGPNRGGLTEPILSELKIEDPIAELRLLFSGWMSVVHVLAMFFFLSPYVLFIVGRLVETWLRHSLGDLNSTNNPVMPSLGWELFQFAAFGYEAREVFTMNFFLRLSTFLIFLTVNTARLLLWLKARELEHKKSIIGIWPQFWFESQIAPPALQLRFSFLTWRFLERCVRIGAVVALICGLFHFVSFLDTPVVASTLK